MIKKTKKKRWFKVVGPKLFNEQVIGELIGFDAESLIGRRLTLNLMSITDNPKFQHINIRFLINKSANEELKTDIIAYSLSLSSIKRQVRKGCKRADDSFICKTKEDKLVKIKPFLITKTNTTNSTVSKLRKSAKEFITKAITSSTFDKLINDILDHKFQSDLKKELSKIYPLKTCEIRFLGLLKTKRETGDQSAREPKEPQPEKPQEKPIQQQAPQSPS